MNADRPLVKAGAEHVLTRYERGESIQQIAADLGVTGPAVYRYLLRNAEAGWREHQASQALHKHDEAEQALESATDGVSVSRARELARLQQWKLERVLRRIYGSDAPAPQINIQIGAVAEQIQRLERELQVDGAPLQLDQPSDPTSGST